MALVSRLEMPPGQLVMPLTLTLALAMALKVVTLTACLLVGRVKLQLTESLIVGL